MKFFLLSTLGLFVCLYLVDRHHEEIFNFSTMVTSNFLKFYSIIKAHLAYPNDFFLILFDFFESCRANPHCGGIETLHGIVAVVPLVTLLSLSSMACKGPNIIDDDRHQLMSRTHTQTSCF
jgi:hypothetical protein